MDLKTQRRLAASLLKSGKGRIKVTFDKEVGDALTRSDVRALIKKGLITKVQKKGIHKGYSKKRLVQKSKGLRKGAGSRKGTIGARSKQKTMWIRQVRALRSLLHDLRRHGMVEKKDYKKLYAMVKGNAFRNRKHLLFYMRENDLLKAHPKAKTERKVAK